MSRKTISPLPKDLFNHNCNINQLQKTSKYTYDHHKPKPSKGMQFEGNHSCLTNSLEAESELILLVFFFSYLKFNIMIRKHTKHPI